ncbi:MAG: tRNA pseudouridine(38-40) synthase TruA [Silvibacterium sp.]
MNWKLTLAYDGTDFHGWQVQPGFSTIQGELAAAIDRVTGEWTLPQGSGRTDAGVHARAQVASFEIAAPIPPQNLLRALNRTLPPLIRILAAEHASPEFHARYSVRAKTYEYRIFRGEICPPWLTRYVYPLNWPLKVEKMRQAAALVVGEHDFTSFAATDPDLNMRQSDSAVPRNNIRTIFFSSWIEQEDLLIYKVRGNGFLHHMVRNLVGTFLDSGREQITTNAITAILERRSRTAAGVTAPARGLFLDSVDYEGHD